MRMVNFTHSKKKSRNRLIKSFAMSLLMSFLFTNLNAQDCPVDLSCLGRINVSLDVNCQAEIYPDRIHSAPDAMPNDPDCDYVVVIKDMDDNIIPIAAVGPTGFPLIDAGLNPEFLIDSFKVELNVDDSDAPCWGWMIVEDKLRPTLAEIPDLTVNCDVDDSGLFEAPDDAVLTAETSIDVTPDDQDMVTFDLGTPDPYPSPIGIVSSAQLSFTADLPDDIVQLDIIDDNDVVIASEASPVSVQNVTGLLSMSIESIEFPITVKFTHAGLADPDTVLISDVTLTLEMESYFDENVTTSVDNCGDITFKIINDYFDDGACQDPEYIGVCSAVRIIEYAACDASGNTSDTLEFEVCYRKKSIIDFSLEPSVTISCNDPLTGIPGLMLAGNPFDPDQYIHCKFNVGINEVVFDGCGPERIIERTYTIIDWCNAEVRTLVQNIGIVDNDAPEVSCGLKTEDYPTNAPQCTANVIVTPFGDDITSIPFSDDCSDQDELVLVVEYLKATTADPNDPDNVYNLAIPIPNTNPQQFRVNGLEFGLNWIRYTVTDACGNASDCTWEINVTDHEAPKAICDQYTVVTLQNNGWARMLPISLDDGSYDDCGGDLIYTAKRLESVHPCKDELDYEVPDDLDNQGFGSFLQFCCADAGQEIDVVLKVTDSAGNFSTCQVIVSVQDKSNIIKTDPDSYVSINCDQYDEDNLYGNPNKPTVRNSCRSFDVEYEDEPDLDDCGIGTITRKWYYLLNGEREYLNCDQIINVSGINYSVRFPRDRNANCDNYDTDLGQQPTINNQNIEDYEGCANLSWTFEDQVFSNVEGLCLKIIRTWIVIDHCVYDPNSTSTNGYYTGTQLIKVANGTAPIITNCPEDEWYNPAPGTCEATVALVGPDATDACLKNEIKDSRYSYEVRLESDGSLIQAGTGRSDLLDITTEVYVVTWFIEDQCGNVNDECSHIVDVVDEKAPTPYCFGGITTVVMDSIFSNGDPFITIWALDFNIASADDCDDDLEFTFSLDRDDTHRTYTCDSLGIRNVRIYVWDDANNYDYCETTVNIQANGDVCGTSSSPRIAGKVETEDQKDVPDVEIGLEHMGNANMNYQMTNTQGLYTFDDTAWADDYNLSAEKDDNPLNGVSTLDLVLIQRHILALERLNSPYKLIAADVNNSESVTSVDLIELRKLILGIYDAFPNNKSWRFINEGHKFTSEDTPWPFAEDISIYNIGSDEMLNNFVGVKTGDVNSSVRLSLIDEDTDNRNSNTLRLNIEEQAYNASEMLKLEVKSTNFDEIFGMQFSLGFNEDEMIFKGIQAAALDIQQSNLGLNQAASGIINFSWNNSVAQSVDEDEVLFTIYFEAKNNTDTDEIFITSDYVDAEAYDSDLNIMHVSLENRNAELVGSELVLYQNNPNPFNNMTSIQFYIPESGKVVFEVFDVTGKTIERQTSVYTKGMQTIEFSLNDTNNGVLYYKISTDKETATRKMLSIK